MKISAPIRPEDILPEEVNQMNVNGVIVRKGTVAAFLANIDRLEDPQLSLAERELVLNTMKELAPAIIAAGLHKHVVFKNPLAEEILLKSIS